MSRITAHSAKALARRRNLTVARAAPTLAVSCHDLKPWHGDGAQDSKLSLHVPDLRSTSQQGHVFACVAVSLSKKCVRGKGLPYQHTTIIILEEITFARDVHRNPTYTFVDSLFVYRVSNISCHFENCCFWLFLCPITGHPEKRGQRFAATTKIK